MLPTHDDSEDVVIDLVEAERLEAAEFARVRVPLAAVPDASVGAPHASTVVEPVGVRPEVAPRKPTTESVGPVLVVPEIRTFSRSYRLAKRLLDIVVSAIVLAVLWPLIVLIALVIRLDSPGPAVFRGERIARGGGRFRFWKFRTMYVDAAQRWPELYAKTTDPNAVDETYYKDMVDPRHTRVGRLIRRTSLDELPNFVSVLRGDVSLVGPRPETYAWARHYRPEQLAKFSVKPGLTGLAVVSGRNELTVRQTIELDLEYVARASFVYDLRIIARTFGAVVRMLGAV